MGILISFLVLLTIGIVFFVLSKKNPDSGFFWSSILPILFGILGTLFAGLFLIMNTIDGKKYVEVVYPLNRAYIESLDSSERKSAVEFTVRTNEIILTNRTFRDNFWLKGFYYYSVGDLELIEMEEK